MDIDFEMVNMNSDKDCTTSRESSTMTDRHLHRRKSLTSPSNNSNGGSLTFSEPNNLKVSGNLPFPVSPAVSSSASPSSSPGVIMKNVGVGANLNKEKGFPKPVSAESPNSKFTF